MTTNTRSKPQPPAAAVAADAHWAAKMQRLRDRHLAQTTFVICDDQTIRARYQRTKRSLEVAQTYVQDHPNDTEAAAQLARVVQEHADAKAAYDDVSIPIVFRALPRPALEALYKVHKPSEAEAEEGANWNASFPAALISAACVDGMTQAEAQELLDSWSLAEANAMFNAAHEIQHNSRTDLGKG